MASVQIYSYGDLTARIYATDCIVLTRRDGKNRGLEGPLAEALVALIRQFGLELLVKHSAAFANAQTSDSSAQLGQWLAELIEGRLADAPVNLNSLLEQAPSLLKHAMAQRIPLYAMIELTYSCNLRCQHCYVLHKVTESSPASLGDSVVKATIDDLVHLGCLSVTLTGGEPTLARAYQSYITAAKDRGLFTTLKTNGTTFTEERAARYADDAAHETHVSLYGAMEATHDGFTAIRGSFRRTIGGLQHLADRGVRCRVNCTIWQGNIGEIEALQKLVEDIGHYLVVDDTIWGRYNGDMSPRELAIGWGERQKLMSAGVLKPFAPAPCTAGAVKVKVDAEGGVATCELLPITFGNVNDRSLSDVWASPELGKFGQAAIGISAGRRAEGNLDLACPGLNILRTGRLQG